MACGQVAASLTLTHHLMRLTAAILVSMLFLLGCQGDIPPSDEPATPAVEAFGAASMRLHPVFTQISKIQNSPKPNGIDVVLEFDDRFHDPTKAVGRVVFELYEFRQTAPDPRGKRLVNPWIGSLESIADQEAHWNRTSRAYEFQLLDPAINVSETYVLTATFDQQEGGRLFDQLILQGKKARLNQIKVHGKNAP